MPKLLRLEEQRPHEWAFNRPEEWDFLDRRLEKAEEAERRGAVEQAKHICTEIIASCPEYLPAINNLALLLRTEGELDHALELFEGAVGLGVSCLPKEFVPGTDRLPWYWEDNRAFIIACEQLGVTHLMKGLEAFEYLLDVRCGYAGIEELAIGVRHICGIEDSSDEK
jgi:hypothetical protein